MDLQGDAFEEGQREEEPGLVAGEPAPESGPLVCLAAGEDQDVGEDVGVLVDVVGVGVVPVVFVVPPGVAHTEEQVAVDQADGAADRFVTGDLGVARVVADERRPGTQYGEQRREEQGPPGVSDEGDAGDHGGQAQQVHDDLACVPAMAPVQQSTFLDLAQEGCEIAAGCSPRALPGGGFCEDGGGLGHAGLRSLGERADLISQEVG